MVKNSSLLFLAFMLMTSCVFNSNMDAIIDANHNIQGIYDVYPNNSKKRELLNYLVENSNKKNLSKLNLDSLKYTVDIAYGVWLNSKWSKEYSFNHFKEYVLPMTISHEPIEYYWREDILHHIELDYSINDIEQFARSINRQIHISGFATDMGVPQKGYTLTIDNNFGKCDDRAILTTMALRSVGIPSAFEYIPNWGSSNNGHSINSAILPNDSIIVFQSHNDREDVFIHHKVPKIYRQTYSPQKNNIVYKRRDVESIPSLFADFRFIDVTYLHPIGKQNIEIELDSIHKNKIVYMSVFSPVDWKPIAFAERQREKVYFKHIGNGLNQLGETATVGDHIGNGILYLPSYYIDDNIVPASRLHIVSKDSVYKIDLCREESVSVVLSRKYPLLQRIKRYSREMINGVFEVANSSDFSDAKQIYTIFKSPFCRMQQVKVNIDGNYKYIRYRKPQGVFSIAELKVYNKSGAEIKGNLIINKALNDQQETNFIVDGDPLTFYSTNFGLNLWAGIEFNSKSDIGYIEFAPRNDDNAVSIGDRYELFYWDGAWCSLGERVATDYTLTYDDVPKGALLWLRNLTRGREERPFTYEEGEQIWW